MSEHDEAVPADEGRRRFLARTTAAVGAAGACCLAVPFARSLKPDAGARAAAAPVTVDISGLKQGERLVVEWRGQPVWILHRSPAMLGRLAALDARLLDPESRNADQQPAYVLAGDREFRAVRPEISVLVGLCTHLGCAPEMVPEAAPQPYDPDWQGGYFCPCHKSRFDLSGRVFKDMPARSNLVVPPHHYADADTLVIGVGPGGKA